LEIAPGLAKSGKMMLDWAEFETVCRVDSTGSVNCCWPALSSPKHPLSSSPRLSARRIPQEDLKTAVRLCHEWGLIFFHPSTPQPPDSWGGTIILDCRWFVTVSQRALFPRSGGASSARAFSSRETLCASLNDPSATSLVQLLISLELLYPIGSTIIQPCLLSLKPPSSHPLYKKAFVCSSATLVRKLVPSFAPSGMWHRLFYRLQSDIGSKTSDRDEPWGVCWWHRGVVFESYPYLVACYTSRASDTLVVIVHGPSSVFALYRRIYRAVNALLEETSRTAFALTEQVSCPSTTCSTKTDESRGFFESSRISRRLESGYRTIECSRCEEAIPLTDLESSFLSAQQHEQDDGDAPRHPEAFHPTETTVIRMGKVVRELGTHIGDKTLDTTRISSSSGESFVDGNSFRNDKKITRLLPRTRLMVPRDTYTIPRDSYTSSP